MSKLSKREKVMLYVVVLLVLVVGSLYLLILPLADDYATQQEELVEMQDRVQERQLAIVGLPIAEENMQLRLEDITRYEAMLYPAMYNETIDMHVTPLLQRHGLVIQTVEISEIQYVAYPAYGQAPPEDIADADTQPAYPMAHINYVQAVCYGSMEGFVAMADEVGRDTSMFLSNFQAMANNDESYAFSFTLAVVMDVNGQRAADKLVAGTPPLLIQQEPDETQQETETGTQTQPQDTQQQEDTQQTPEEPSSPEELL